MLSLGSSHSYYLYRAACDMRKSFDSLSGLVRNELGRDPASGEVFVFINKRRNSVKLLHWERVDATRGALFCTTSGWRKALSHYLAYLPQILAIAAH